MGFGMDKVAVHGGDDFGLAKRRISAEHDAVMAVLRTTFQVTKRENAMRSLLSAALVLASAAVASAEAPQRAICAVEQAIVCPPHEVCERSLPGALNLPTLLKIDRSAGVVLSRTEAGVERSSIIGGEAGGEGFQILQGVDGEAPWSIRVDLKTGRFVLTSAQAEAGYIGFGFCSARLLE